MPGKNGIRIEVCGDFEGIESIQNEWDAFVESEGGEIRLTFDWCRVWWRHYGRGRKLQICIFRDEKEYVAILPVFFERLRVGPISLIAGKCLCTDFGLGTVVVPIRRAYCDEVIGEFVEQVVRPNGCDILCFGPLSGRSGQAGVLTDALRAYAGCDFVVKDSQRTHQTYFMLEKNWDGYLATFSKKRQRDILRKYRLLREELNIRDDMKAAFADDGTVSDMFSRFYEMHQSHWQQQNKNGHFGDWPGSRDFHLEVAKGQLVRKRLRLLEIRAGSQVLGYKYGYRFGNVYTEYLDARAEDAKLERTGLGEIIFCEQAKKAIEESAQLIDSLPGVYEHKRRMGGVLMPVKSILVYSRRPFAVVKICILRLLARVLHVCYYRLWFCRVAPRLPFRRRPLWGIWIRTHSLL